VEVRILRELGVGILGRALWGGRDWSRAEGGFGGDLVEYGILVTIVRDYCEGLE